MVSTTELALVAGGAFVADRVGLVDLGLGSGPDDTPAGDIVVNIPGLPGAGSAPGLTNAVAGLTGRVGALEQMAVGGTDMSGLTSGLLSTQAGAYEDMLAAQRESYEARLRAARELYDTTVATVTDSSGDPQDGTGGSPFLLPTGIFADPSGVAEDTAFNVASTPGRILQGAWQGTTRAVEQGAEDTGRRWVDSLVTPGDPALRGFLRGATGIDLGELDYTDPVGSAESLLGQAGDLAARREDDTEQGHAMTERQRRLLAGSTGSGRGSTETATTPGDNDGTTNERERLVASGADLRRL